MATAKDITGYNRTLNMTDTWVKGKKPLAAPEWSDQSYRGLRLRVSPKGRKTWYYRFTLNAKVRKVTIGTYPATSLQDARGAWVEMSALRKKGIDPARHLEAEAAENRQAELETAKQQDATLARLVADYVDEISRTHKSWAKTESTLNRYLAPYLIHRADEVTRGDVRDVLAKLRDAGKDTTANRALAAIRAMYNWALTEDWPKRQGFLTANPAWQIKATKETSRQRVLSDKELRTILKKLPKSGLSEAVQELLVVTLLTGCRIGEVCAMQWKHIHDDEWRLPAELTKNGRAHTVYLSEQAQAILNRHKSGAYVFSNPGTHHGYMRRDSVEWMLRRALGVDVKVPKAERVNRLGVEPFTPHDMRRSLATWLGENQVDEKIHDRMLNHHKSTISAVYNVAKYNKPAREWWTNWGNHVQALSADNVVPLKTKGV